MWGNSSISCIERWLWWYMRFSWWKIQINAGHWFYKALSFARQGDFVGSLTYLQRSRAICHCNRVVLWLEWNENVKNFIALGVNTGRNQDETELSTTSVWEMLQFKWQQFYVGTDWFISPCLPSVPVSRAGWIRALRRSVSALCRAADSAPVNGFSETSYTIALE